MDKRHLQTIGGASYSVTLPKKWISKNNLKRQDVVEISLKQTGALLLRPALENSSQSAAQLSMDKLDAVTLHRELISHYILGFDHLELNFLTVPQEKRAVIRRALEKLVGLEIVEESAQRIVLKNFFKFDNFSFSEYLATMFTTTEAMLLDSVSAFINHNKALAKDVADRDLEVDKTYFLVTRVFHALLADKLLEEAVGCSLLTADYYRNIARQLERIADHAVKIAGVVERMPGSAKPKLGKAMEEIVNVTTTLLEEAGSFTKTFDKDKANKALHVIDRTNKELVKLTSEIVKSGFAPAAIVSDSLDRCRNYIGNMAEHTIGQAIAEADKGQS